MSAEKLKGLIEDSYNLLGRDNKQGQVPIVKRIFDNSETDTETKLIVLDSLYSTNANKSIGVIKDIACSIDNYIKQDESNLNFKGFIEDPISEKRLYRLFAQKYGKKSVKSINNGETGVKTNVSLISKYFYYYTNLKFPIYDSLVREMLYMFFKNHGTKKTRGDVYNMKTYFPAILEFSDLVGLSNDGCKYDKIDAFGWLIGKIKTKNVFFYINDEDEKGLSDLVSELVFYSFLNKEDQVNYEKNKIEYNKAIVKAEKLKKDAINKIDSEIRKV